MEELSRECQNLAYVLYFIADAEAIFNMPRVHA